MSDERAALIAAADRALAAQDLARAAALLEEALSSGEDFSVLLRLAGVQRAAGRPRFALAAVHRALALAPLDFTALMMRASLLDRIGDPGAGEAWGHAIAQRPDEALPPQLAQVLAEGERKYAAWLDAKDARWSELTGDAEARADAGERDRIARFRSNALRRTRPYHSEPTHFHFPGLREREFHPRSLFPWLADIEAATDTIADELDAVMNAERAELVPYVQYAAHQPLDQWRTLNHNPDWTAIHLMRGGRRIEANARHCPATLALIEGVAQPVIAGASPNVMFSLLAPGTAIPPHVGYNNARLVCHLPLVVPAGCWFRVGAETREWRRGAAFVFDDTIEHEAMNPSDRLRVVLIFDLWHPDLTPVEREAVAALIGSDANQLPENA
ncbi:Aspartyl/Asparaginyl beta-hydroxylase [Sphingopyxis sp. YR583]|uniref:aspartyl/asparaginyl beta-hydroxylase domain-containing protein n=1 Tax=Sphingopyxis sp. YR583 TaxID=1881047 RepID=UPI0008A79C6C|nr:aspartyl/asparaginyl beta-hydroxylase domain-containing protein [Sphingopyxis sp. YR583]SEH16629.1 Aspartyl/Asparaginyl beta-hydroxylase [Sphingopyxis sp. YR583]